MIDFGQNSFGTMYGTVRDYGADGQDVGPKDITGYGVFMAVRESWNPSSRLLIRKETGNGITITDAPNGKFTVTFQASDLTYNPSDFVYTVWLNPLGTFYYEGTTQLKAIGSGVFRVRRSVKYGAS